MCLITNDKTLYTAKEDLSVLKILTQYKDYCSPIYQTFKYKYDKLYETAIVQSADWCSWNSADSNWLHKNWPGWTMGHDELICIGSGFHSFISMEQFHDSVHFYITCRARFNNRVFQCIVPKGSKFYKNELGMIVSNKIIVKKLAPNQDLVLFEHDENITAYDNISAE